MLWHLKIALLISASLSSLSYAKSLHVSKSGSDLSGNGSESKPWMTPEYGAKQLNSGDTLLIHPGTYTLSQENLPSDKNDMNRARALVSPPSGINGTIDSPIIIKSTGDGKVFLDAGSSPQWAAIGTNSGDYLEIDGFSIRGAAILWSTKGAILKNCNLFGGIDTPQSNNGDNFGAVVRVENCIDCLVQNNLLHDNQIGITLANSPLLIEYDSTNLIIENNDIYNSVGIGIRLKDNPNQVHIRNNYIYDNYLSGIQGANQDSGFDIFIYKNIIRNNNISGGKEYGGISQLVEVIGWQIYNNTFINNKNADIRTNYSQALSDIEAWNNLHVNNNENFYSVGWFNSGASFSSQWKYSDYNNFYGNSSWVERSNIWNTLEAFSNAVKFDSNSISANPNFINIAGKHSKSFQRTSYPKNGRGGEFEQVMGAYITGNETIGSNGIRKTPKSPAEPIIN